MKFRFQVGLIVATMITGSFLLAQNQASPPALRGNVRYNVRQEFSRLTLYYGGAIQHTEELQGDVLTIRFSGIKSAPSLNGARMNFESGLIEKAVVERISNESSTTTLTLRKRHGSYKISTDETQKCIFVDVMRDETLHAPVAVLDAVRPERKNTAKGAQSSLSSGSKTPLVDIGSMVRQQLNETERRDRPAGQGASSMGSAALEQTNDPEEAPAGKRPIVWLMVACFALLVTVCFMALVAYGRTRRKSSSIGRSPLEVQSYPRPRVSLPVVEEQVTENPASDADVLEDEFDAESSPESPALELAEQYHRNRGEVEFAMKLRNDTRLRGYLTGTGSRRRKHFPVKGTVNIAKKLGVGKGEVDLAAKLLKLSNVNLRKEKAA